jgi:hypothetical protein
MKIQTTIFLISILFLLAISQLIALEAPTPALVYRNEGLWTIVDENGTTI